MRIVFVGTGEIGVPSLRRLAALEGCELAGVITQPDRPAGRSLRLRPSPVKEAALAMNLPIEQPARLRSPEALAQLAALRPDLLVVAAYGQILSPAVLALPPLGCLNIHASLLPRHRGASPIHAAILAGDTRSGVTIMWMDEGLDTGDILLQEETPIGPDETAGSLHDRLAGIAPKALARALALIGAGTALRIPQDAALASYAPKLSKESGRIDWSQSAGEIDRQVRGLSPWPGAFTLFGGEFLKIHRGHPLPGTAPAGEVTAAEGLVVGCGAGLYAIEELQAAGGKRLAAEDYRRGHALPAGTQLGA